MTNVEVCKTQFALLWAIITNGSLALLFKQSGLPPEQLWLVASIAVLQAPLLLCMVIMRGWMPKDKFVGNN